MRIGRLAALAAATVTAAGALALPAQATPDLKGSTPPAGATPPDEIGDYPTDYLGKHRPLDLARSAAALRRARSAGSVGSRKAWPAIDFVTNDLYFKRYQLRGQGKHIQVWVADDREFPAGDCRNDLGITDVTDRQVTAFIHQFDDRILPIESNAFSVAPDRDGSASAELAASMYLPESYWRVGRRHADDTVVLVDNVRDEDYYAPGTPAAQTRVGGFFTPEYAELLDRNIMTVDSYDWRHQSGANPPDDSQDPAYVACGAELGAPEGGLGTPDPRDYEATFAHEYQHLLESYEDDDEALWVNEGLSDYAQTLTGYVDPSVPPHESGANSDIACFTGHLGRRFGGAENSLTSWGDQGDPEILCDYGAAYSFMQYLFDRYGVGFLSALHRQDRNGIAGLDRVLDTRADGSSAPAVLHRWAATMALDAILDRNGGRLVGAQAGRYRAATLSAGIRWANPQSYDEPGAPLNGSDLVRLRDASGRFLSAGDVDSIEFSGSSTIAPQPVEWTADATPPNGTTTATTCGTVADGAGPAALHSGCGDELDRSIVREVSIPSTPSPELSFDLLLDAEEGWDFGFVQVSTDGGDTWASLPTEDTTSAHAAEASPSVVSELPGFTGDSGSWTTQTADLSPYSGQDVLLGFRYITDTAAAEAGMWVRDIEVAGSSLPSGSLAGWQTITQAHPYVVPDFAGFTVQLIAYGRRTEPAHLARLPLDRSLSGSLAGRAVAEALSTTGTTVAAVVTADDPTEAERGQVLYRLTVNGVEQPGGGGW